jgi:hypothetical protein
VHRDFALRNDWTAVQRFVDIMHRAPTDCRAVFQS